MPGSSGEDCWHSQHIGMMCRASRRSRPMFKTSEGRREIISGDDAPRRADALRQTRWRFDTLHAWWKWNVICWRAVIIFILVHCLRLWYVIYIFVCCQYRGHASAVLICFNLRETNSPVNFTRHVHAHAWNKYFNSSASYAATCAHDLC